MTDHSAQKPWLPMQALSFVFMWLAILRFILWLDDWLLSESAPNLESIHQILLSDLIKLAVQIAIISILVWSYRAVNRLRFLQVLIAGCVYFVVQISYWLTQHLNLLHECMYKHGCGMFEWSYFIPIIYWFVFFSFCIANYYREKPARSI